MKTVELQTAFHWYCEECSYENFALPQKAELNDEAREAAFRQFHQLDEWAELPEQWAQFEIVCVPDIVICNDCKTEFNTVDALL